MKSSSGWWDGQGIVASGCMNVVTDASRSRGKPRAADRADGGAAIVSDLAARWQRGGNAESAG